MELLLIAAGRVIFGPILGRVWADVQQAAADKVEGVVKGWWNRRTREPDGDPVLSPNLPQPVEVVPQIADASDAEIAVAMDRNPEKAEEFRLVLEEILGVDLKEAPTGTDDRILASYEALIWRAAVITGWERRPVALAGSLLGPRWVTVCNPTVKFEPGAVVDPSALWRTDDHGDLVRATDPSAPVEFYLRQFPDQQASTSESESLNRSFVRTHRFQEGPSGPVGDVWHRIDGLNRGWVRFKWDHVVKANVQRVRHPEKNFFGDAYLHKVDDRDLKVRPPEFSEFPDDWQDAMSIADPAASIDSLRTALDMYASASAESLAKARAALEG